MSGGGSAFREVAVGKRELQSAMTLGKSLDDVQSTAVDLCQAPYSDREPVRLVRLQDARSNVHDVSISEIHT